MAKYKRKPSAAQRDKVVIETAKKLKKAGILNKNANLHSGNYVSRDVLRKVRQYSDFAALNYKAVSVSKKTAQAAKERGFAVVAGNKIIGPSTPQFRNRLKKGELTGVRPIKGAYMEEVVMPHTVYDLYTLVQQLEDGIDTLKMPDEVFAFKYHGNESRRTFKTTDEMLDYMRNYKGITAGIESLKPEDQQEQFENLIVYRLSRKFEALNIPTDKQRRARREKQRLEDARNGIYKPRKYAKTKSSRQAIAERKGPVNGPKWLAEQLKKDADKRARQMADPAKAAKVREQARERAKRNRRKG